MKGKIFYCLLICLLFSCVFLTYAQEARAGKLTNYFIVLKVDHVDSLKDSADQRVIMQRAIELLQEKLKTLKLKSAGLEKRAKDIIIIFYQGSGDPWGVAKALQPKDLVVSFTVIGIFKGSEIPRDPAR